MIQSKPGLFVTLAALFTPRNRTRRPETSSFGRPVAARRASAQVVVSCPFGDFGESVVGAADAECPFRSPHACVYMCERAAGGHSLLPLSPSLSVSDRRRTRGRCPSFCTAPEARPATASQPASQPARKNTFAHLCSLNGARRRGRRRRRGGGREGREESGGGEGGGRQQMGENANFSPFCTGISTGAFRGRIGHGVESVAGRLFRQQRDRRYGF